MDIVTAVLSGDRSLELRVFADEIVSLASEQLLTKRLCKLMDRHKGVWQRFVGD